MKQKTNIRQGHSISNGSFFENINKINKTLARLVKKEKIYFPYQKRKRGNHYRSLLVFKKDTRLLQIIKIIKCNYSE